ncbi:MAG: hypothetical protein JW768_05040 [Chitinispirillaceae bacterium]|nr:hypothetical protein [Chitinispirillaceae bacterium]
MRTTVMTVVLLSFFSTQVPAQDRIREFFEWGEYDSLLVAIPAYCSGDSGRMDSSLLCDYFSYLGVAFFAKGNLADARGAFKQAILCRNSLDLDTQYVTAEMLSLFADARQEIEKENEQKRKQDSLARVRDRERKEREARGARLATLSSEFRRTAWYSGTFFVACAVGAGAAVYEYRAGLELDRDFRAAAEIGDKMRYDRYQELLVNQNRNILGFSAASLVSGCLAVYLCSRCVSLSRMKSKIVFSGEKSGIILAIDF